MLPLYRIDGLSCLGRRPLGSLGRPEESMGVFWEAFGKPAAPSSWNDDSPRGSLLFFPSFSLLSTANLYSEVPCLAAEARGAWRMPTRPALLDYWYPDVAVLDITIFWERGGGSFYSRIE